MRSSRTGALLVLLVAGALVAAAAASSSATPRRVLLGVLGNPERFQQLTGQVSDSRLRVVGWGQGATRGAPFLELFRTMGAVPLLGLSTGIDESTDITPRQIALGEGDGYLVALNRAFHAWGRPIFFRPFAEMNAHWNKYSAYDPYGPKRDGAHTTALFRAAFARV